MSKEKANENRQLIIAKLIPVFRQYGYEGATLSRLSEATGLGRSSLYHHFPGGKEEMAAEVLAYVHNWFAKTVLEPLQTNDKPSQRLQVMCENLDAFYRQGKETCLLNVISLGEGNDLFHTNIKQALIGWIKELASVLVFAGIKPNIANFRAEEAVMLIQGALVLVRGLDETTPFERIVSSLPERLLQNNTEKKDG